MPVVGEPSFGSVKAKGKPALRVMEEMQAQYVSSADAHEETLIDARHLEGADLKVTKFPPALSKKGLWEVRE
ncbi:hypothetical protein APY94_03935 [Thermococcus celericrescens]|uniref:Uncharacterized protein n=1 Tax=Thermococcus celericrescens TaxID=227598 RepID=A0A100XYL7_9EURY|nr:hypothetical protein [Thermococcus celericrescens]KUH33889.1 hypothetical protein APY94_03935 [Thermococcus celericrescens]